MTTIDEDVVSKGRGGMDLGWVSLIRISPWLSFCVLLLFLFFHLLLYSFFTLLAHFLCLFLCFVLFFFLFEATRTSPFWRGVHVIG
jgi:hypothetical protein